jgi:hypothetical protein
MRTFTTYLLASLLVFATGTASAQSANSAETFVIARTGIMNGQQTYNLVEVFQQRGRWIYPDVGYIDFAAAGKYREIFAGAGAMLLNSKRFTVIEEGFIDQTTGPASKGATYFQPWTYVGCRLTKKIASETVYFPYLPLNKAGRIQHVLERAKLEYGFKHLKVGGGYGAYKFGDDKWQNKPFVTTTLKAGRFGNIELWLQKMPQGHAQVQIRYAKVFH